MTHITRIQPKRMGYTVPLIDPLASRIHRPKSTREIIERAVVGILGAAMLGFFLAWLVLGGVG